MNKTMANNKGFTFVEVLIAIAILALGFIGLSAMSGNAIRGVDSAKKLSAAANLAEAKLEALKAVPYTNLEVSQTDGGITRTCTAYTCSGNTALSSISNGNGSITRTCPTYANTDGNTTGCTTVYTCVPTTDNPVDLNNTPTNPNDDYRWFWKTMIANVDGLNGCVSSSDGLKVVDMYVQWTDTFGTRTAQLSTLRAQ